MGGVKFTESQLIAKGLKYTSGNSKQQKIAVEKSDGAQEMKYSIFIPGDVPSSKNGRTVAHLKDRNGQPMYHENGLKKTTSLYSKATQKYLDEREQFYKDNVLRFLRMSSDKPLPLRVGYKLVRRTKVEYDDHNAIQIVADLMEKHNWIQKDSSQYVKFSAFTEEYDSENPGIILIIM